MTELGEELVDNADELASLLKEQVIYLFIKSSAIVFRLNMHLN